MKVDTVIRVKDVPGMLVKILEPIGKHGGNVVSITHSRTEKDVVMVYVSFNVKDHSSLDLIIKDFEKEKIHAAQISVEGRSYYVKKSFPFILVGHVIDKDMQDTIDRLNNVGMVSTVEVMMTSPQQKSSVLMEVEVDGRKYETLMELLQKICAEKDFLLVRSI
jgi:ACT domain-containing protein